MCLRELPRHLIRYSSKPWEVAYTMSLPGGLRIGDIKRMRVSSANERVSVDKEGVYELVEVRTQVIPLGNHFR